MAANKNQLNYSELTDKVVFVNNRGEKIDLHQNFIQNMLLYLTQGKMPKLGDSINRELSSGGEPMWKITLERLG